MYGERGETYWHRLEHEQQTTGFQRRRKVPTEFCIQKFTMF